nr:putative reverse transcriptase, RNA-dependent DNA polymerase [Tanacetum cinerariifolium]
MKEADRLGLAFPSLNLILGVGSASIDSSISAGSTPPVSAGSTPPMSLCVSPISANRHYIYAGKCHVSAGRPSGSAARTPVPADIHDGLKIFDCPKSGIFTSSSYDEEFVGPDANNLERSLDVRSTITKRIHNIHPTSHVLSDINSPVQTRRQVKHTGSSESAFISYIHDQRRNNHIDFQLWAKWILKNKRDAKGIVCRNKARLVAQGHIQEEGIDYSDVFALVARIEVIRLFLAFASFMGFRVYQMDVKSAFLYEKIAEELSLTVIMLVRMETGNPQLVDAVCWEKWFLFTSAGRVTFCWLFPIPTGDLVSAGHMLFLLVMYALTANPTIYASVVRQFWGSASEVSLPDGVRGLVATIDGTAYTVTEASIRSVLQLDDLNAIDTMTNEEIFVGLRDIGTPYPTPLVTKKIFANMRRYQGPDMPLLVHMLNLGEPAFEQAQQPDVHQPPPSPVVAPHPSPDPMPSPSRQSSPPPIPFGPTTTSGLVSSEPIPDIPSSSGPSEPVLETINSPFGDDDTGGGSFHESPPRPPPATLTISPTVGVTEEPLTLTSLLALFPTCLQRIATLEAELKATKILHRDTVVLFAKRIKKLKSKLKTKKRNLVLSDSENKEEARQSKELDALLDLANAALHAPSLSTTPSKPANQEQARAATIIYKRLKKQKSSSGLDFTNADIPAGGLDSAGGLVSAGGVDSAGRLTSAGISVAAGPTVPAEPSLLAQRVAKEHDRESMASEEQSTQRQAELDKVALILTNEEWISLVNQVRAHPTLSAELLGADVSEDTFSVRMVELMNRQRKAIVEIKAKEKREKPMNPDQQKEFMRTFVKNQSSAIYTTGWTWKFVRGLTDDQLRIKYDKIRRAVDLATAKDQHQHLKRSELQETTSVSACVPIAAGDPISVDFSVSAGSSIPAATLITANVSTTAGASGFANEASILVIELFDSPPKDTSLPLDPETDDLDEPLRKSSRKKSIARKRTLPSPDALPFDEDDPEAAFKRYLRQASDDDEPAESVSLALVSDITTWEIIPIEFGLGEMHVIIRVDGTVKRFSTLRELLYWAGRADLMGLYGLVSNKYKTERATAGDIMYMFVDKKYPLTPETLQRMLNHCLEIDRDPSGNDLTTAIQLIQSLLDQLNPAA